MTRLTLRSFVLVLFDTPIILAALAAAAYLRLGRFISTLRVEHGIWKMLLVVAVTQGSLYVVARYDTRPVFDRREMFIRIVQGVGVASWILALVYFFAPELAIGRGVVVIALIFVIMFLIGWRLMFDVFRRRVSS